jgi:para-nitrobenzyl esterase
VPDSNGRKFAEQTGAIVVAANYRFGPLGFMGHPALTGEDPAYPASANYGFLDQRAAMAWVRDHIAAFGGDPDNVTIFGQSAGGQSVSLHVVSPRGAGYFGRAIMQSGFASFRWPTLEDAEAIGTSFAARVGCTDPTQVLSCMRGKTRNEVLLAFANGQQEFAESGRVVWGPVVDGLDIPDQPRVLYEDGNFNHVPTILGATRDEGWIYVDRSFPGGLTPEEYEAAVATEFGAADAPAILAMYPAADFPSPKHALSRLTGDFEMVCEARRVARLIERTRTPVYLYSFEREVDAVVPDLVIHGLDRNFVFGNNFGPPSNYVLNQDDLALFGAMSGYWTRFAATGDPNGSDSVSWPRFTHPSGHGRGASRHIVFDWPVREGERLREDQCDFWERLFLRSVTDAVPASNPSSDLCGAVITADLKLDHNLACSGDALIVGADGITLDLNGRTITGSGTGAGIGVAGRTHVAIVGGIVKNFEAGVRITNSTHTAIEQNELSGNTDGIDLQVGSRGILVRGNTLRDNRSRGIMLRSGTLENVVAENDFAGNRVGILLFGTSGTAVVDNVVSTSVLAGIRLNVLATGNLIRGNQVASNPAGIEFLVTPSGSSVGNQIVVNTLSTNTCGLKGPSDGNTIGYNTFTGNVADICQ